MGCRLRRGATLALAIGTPLPFEPGRPAAHPHRADATRPWPRRGGACPDHVPRAWNDLGTPLDPQAHPHRWRRHEARGRAPCDGWVVERVLRAHGGLARGGEWRRSVPGFPAEGGAPIATVAHPRAQAASRSPTATRSRSSMARPQRAFTATQSAT